MVIVTMPQGLGDWSVGHLVCGFGSDVFSCERLCSFRRYTRDRRHVAEHNPRTLDRAAVHGQGDGCGGIRPVKSFFLADFVCGCMHIGGRREHYGSHNFVGLQVMLAFLLALGANKKFLPSTPSYASQTDNLYL